MASSPEFVAYVCEQIAGAGEVRSRKMFGEYMVYVDERPLLLVCDNAVYVNQLECLAATMRGAECGVPYAGARLHYVLDIDDGELARRVVRLLVEATPLPKKPRNPGQRRR